jgi:dolichyl-phosphate beta-glucosyltransferase
MVQMNSEKPSLSLVIPAYNEAARIAAPLHEVGAYLRGRPYASEIIVVDDGSTDATSDVVRRSAAKLTVPVRILRYSRNRGKGFALKVGFDAARGERILFTDADLSTPIRETSRLLESLDQGYDIVIGSRRAPGALVKRRQPWYRERLGKLFTFLVRHLIADVSDATCGFKAFESSVGKELFSRTRIHDWSFDAELLLIARQRGYRTKEIPVQWEDRAGTKVSLIRDIVSSLIGLLRIRFNAAVGNYSKHNGAEPMAEIWWSNRDAPPREQAWRGLRSSLMTNVEHVVQQKHFYDTRDHEHLRANERDHYAQRIARRLASTIGIRPEHKVLELGAGFGRFTLPLLEFCSSVVAVDVSQRVLDALVLTRDERGIPEERCQVYRANADELSEARSRGQFDFIVGFFFLHHLADPTRTITRLASLLGPGGRMAFVEPNRRNPLFALQVMFCPDMTWRQEKGMFRLSRKSIEAAFDEAQLLPCETQTFGFFPPQVLNRLAPARWIEDHLEGMRALHWILPFLLLHAQAPGADERA